ncbi:hypothetical protein KY361_06900 [Candidatus Woesearchaeota archaeon]|nr:hypothetical protein [Candidatus Woesearchaeota archaeon]
MDQFRKVLREINSTLGNISVFDNLLDAVIIFLVCFLILILIKFYPLLALIPAIIYMIVAPIKKVNKLKRKKAKIVEESYPPLKEKLRTAVDNIQVSNPIVEALQREVISDMRNVRISSFISGKSTSYKILVSVSLCFIILFVAAHDFGVDIKDLADKGRKIIDAAYVIGGDELGEELGEIMAATGGTELDDIYGKESTANLGNEVIDVELKPISYEIDVRKVKDVEEKEFEETILDETCADEGACTPQESFRNEYPKEQQELVKNYFLKISK